MIDLETIDLDEALRQVYDPFRPYLARRVGWRWQVFEDCTDGVVRSLYLGPFWRKVSALKVAQALLLARVYGQRDQYAVEHGDPLAAMSDMSGVTPEMRGWAVPEGFEVSPEDEAAILRAPGYIVWPRVDLTDDLDAAVRSCRRWHAVALGLRDMMISGKGDFEKYYFDAAMSIPFYGAVGDPLPSEIANPDRNRIASSDIPNRISWPDPDDAMMKRPEFLAIWDVIVGWDIAVPRAYGGYCGATGNHVRAILDGLDGLTWEGKPHVERSTNWTREELERFDSSLPPIKRVGDAKD